MNYEIVTKDEFKQFVTLVGIIIEKEKELGRHSDIDEYGTTFLERLFLILNEAEAVAGEVWTIPKIKLCILAIKKMKGISDNMINNIERIEYINSLNDKKEYICIYFVFLNQ
jgi:hypothetical protein